MLNINMEFIQAFNPLYAVPIVAVILCAFLVFTFGFKSPIQPPSFEGLEEDKKSSKKRKTKEIQKQNKLVTNGKANGIATSKGKLQETPKKKETVDISMVNEKPRSNVKTSTDKKVLKKTKNQNEKLIEKKKDTVTDEHNDDGWVQHVSKKGKKNRKKEDNASTEIQPNFNPSPTKKTIESSVKADKVPLNSVEVPNEGKKEKLEEKPLKKTSKKEATSMPTPEKPIKVEIAVEKLEEKTLRKSSKKEAVLMPSPEKPIKVELAVEVKPEENNLDCDLKKTSNIPTVAEDSSKSKKKKKKQGTVPVMVEANSVATQSIQVEPPSIIAKDPLDLPKVSEPVIANVPVSTPEDSKTNVVFDELAGLYPEAKEKKKKKVRRDH